MILMASTTHISTKIWNSTTFRLDHFSTTCVPHRISGTTFRCFLPQRQRKRTVSISWISNTCHIASLHYTAGLRIFSHIGFQPSMIKLWWRMVATVVTWGLTFNWTCVCFSKLEYCILKKQYVFSPWIPPCILAHSKKAANMHFLHCRQLAGCT